MITGISHMTFIVKNLDRTTTFLETVFDAKEVYASGEKQFSLSEEKFFLIRGVWICIMKGDPLQERSYNHIAFKVTDEEFDVYRRRVLDLEVEIRLERYSKA